jgi:hypothetical protein
MQHRYWQHHHLTWPGHIGATSTKAVIGGAIGGAGYIGHGRWHSGVNGVRWRRRGAAIGPVGWKEPRR